MSLGQRDWLGTTRYYTAAANAERKKSLLSLHLHLSRDRRHF